MNRKELLVRFITTFLVTFMVAMVVTFLWSLVRHGSGAIDWRTSFRLALILAIALPVSAALRRRDRRKENDSVPR